MLFQESNVEGSVHEDNCWELGINVQDGMDVDAEQTLQGAVEGILKSLNAILETPTVWIANSSSPMQGSCDISLIKNMSAFSTGSNDNMFH